MSTPDSDPRVFFAAERTLLAWFRTGIAIMAFGFVIARFGLFLRLVSLQVQNIHSNHYSGLSSALGIALVLAGALTIFGATIQHRRFISTLPEKDWPSSYFKIFSQVVGLFIGLIGVILVVYLAASRA